MPKMLFLEGALGKCISYSYFFVQASADCAVGPANVATFDNQKMFLNASTFSPSFRNCMQTNNHTHHLNIIVIKVTVF